MNRRGRAAATVHGTLYGGGDEERTLYIFRFGHAP
jgi:hypothetical protein